MGKKLDAELLEAIEALHPSAYGVPIVERIKTQRQGLRRFLPCGIGTVYAGLFGLMHRGLVECYFKDEEAPPRRGHRRLYWRRRAT